jgi:IPT/TIG domain-containing protein
MRRTSFLSSIVLLLLTVACSESSRPTGPGGSTTPLKVNAVSPSTGSTLTGTAIQILGTGFVNGSSLTLDGAAASVTFVNSTLLRATAPPHAAGPIDVVVRNPNGDTSELKGGFRYQLGLTKLALTGNLSLRSVGETSQLTATAFYEDASTADVTREARWTVALPSVATIATDGLLTARALGRTSLQVQYPLTGSVKFASAELVVTPPGTQAVRGRVRQPGAGNIVDATVTHHDSGQSVRTSTDGIFTFGGLTGRIRLSVTKSGFEDVDSDFGDATALDIPMQRVVRVEAGAPQYSSSLAPNDVEYVIGGAVCQPCRLIRIASPTARTVNVTLRWTSVAILHLWTEGRMVDAAAGAREIVVPVEIGNGEAVIFTGVVGANPAGYVPLTVSAQ